MDDLIIVYRSVAHFGIDKYYFQMEMFNRKM